MSRLVLRGSRALRFDSDADTLPFPAGGVHAISPGGRREPGSSGLPEQLELTFERMLRQIDALRDGVEGLTLHFPPPLAWRPPAA